ncbi:ATP-dependent DNA helicase PIF1 [Grifola frondosa]|uniref:ATP-dependent DNA helicase n=1 Tax=Grifola frondosa TaxID=5627 RepID=A0A1C7MDS3_GRIFR|nr:ATP-dependent DNA helicase PIF1 [Grifola frondosa]
MLFKPGGWRTGKHLKEETLQWETAFNQAGFTDMHRRIMKNMNLLYECLDARDDYTAQRRAADREQLPAFAEGSHDDSYDACVEDYTEEDLVNSLDETVEHMGKRSAKHRLETAYMRELLSLLRPRVDEPPQFQDSPLYVPVTESMERRSPARWMSSVEHAKQQVLARKQGASDGSQITVRVPLQPPMTRANAIVREVSLDELNRLLDHSLDISRGPQDASIALFTKVVCTFNLNVEQTRAFYIIAIHLHHRVREPLHMYLGAWAAPANEPYRFVVLGPTGTAACIVDGMTYHSMLGFGHQSDSGSSVSALEKVRGRLERVDLIFIDEVSMISCGDLYKISAQISKSFNDPAHPFGGKSMIFAGDFAQLPPPVVDNTLYTAAILGRGAKAIVALLRKMLWERLVARVHYRGDSTPEHETTGCVIDPSSADATLDTPRFKNVSIITARNAHRDAINAFGVERFAADTGRRLHHFHSVDNYATANEAASVRATQRHIAATIDPVRKSDTIDCRVQNALWHLAPTATDHHAGILSLCEGMPVLLKHNDTTELCATNGAEGVVVGWDAHMSATGYEILDVLFVRLTNAPRTIHVAGLPDNVIPLTRHRKKIRCMLPSDEYVTIWREQVAVLWNFAMTDFGAQGKTRDRNVCHLKYCRNHQSIYTCLSRSASFKGTVLIGDLDSSKMQGGAAGDLRRELRELEILDSITKMRLTGTLPPEIHGNTRGPLIQSFQDYYGRRYVPDHVPTALNWADLPEADLQAPEAPAQWTLVGTDRKHKYVSASTPEADVSKPTKRTRQGKPANWTGLKSTSPDMIPHTHSRRLLDGRITQQLSPPSTGLVPRQRLFTV